MSARRPAALKPAPLSWKRYLLAAWRDTRVLVRQFRLPLLLLAASVLVGGLLFDQLYTHPQAGTSASQTQGLSYSEAVYAVFSMIFFDPSIPLPRQWYLQAFFYLMPLVGLGLITQGVVRFGVMLFNKRARKEQWQVAIASTYQDHVVVAGLGRLGFRIVHQLLDLGEEVVGIEIDPNTEFVQRVMDRRVPVISGDATRPNILEQAGIERACSIVTCTENDLTNLEIALVARELKPGIRVVLRMFDDDMASKVAAGFDFSVAFSTSALSAPAFAAAAMRGDIQNAFYVGDQVLNVSKLTVGPRSELVGQKIGDLEQRLDMSIIAHNRAASVDLHPKPGIALQPGDQICVFASLDVLSQMSRMNLASEHVSKSGNGSA
ncbi:MAG: NAD-binding protein [Anaerolineae bacterium]|nr:NAD-binding protein [Anaerolineae bacterium]